MKTAARWGLGVALAGGLIVPANVYPREGYAIANVKDAVTQAPIAEVGLTLDCFRNKGLGGHESVGTMHVRSAEDGSYSIPLAWAQNCAFVGQSPTKEGYQNAGLIEHSGRPVPILFNPAVPPVVWMVKNADVHSLQLRTLLDESNSVRQWPKGPMPLHDYLMVNGPFHKSVGVASAPAEVGWVRDHYCNRLAALWQALAESDKQALGHYSDIESHENLLVFCHSSS